MTRMRVNVVCWVVGEEGRKVGLARGCSGQDARMGPAAVVRCRGRPGACGRSCRRRASTCGRRGGSESRAGFHTLARPSSVVPLSPLPFAAPEGGLTAPQASASSPFQSTPSSSTHPQPGSIAPQSWPWHAASPAQFLFFFRASLGVSRPKNRLLCALGFGVVWVGVAIPAAAAAAASGPSVRSLAYFTRAGFCWPPVT